ncbi:MAG: hemolysin family protein [Bdellovibrionales bacterium]
MLGEILIIVLILLLNGFFAASEMAIVSSRKARLKQRADDGHRGARLALELAEDSGRFLSSVQIGITILGVFAGAYGGATFAEPLAVYLRPYFPEHADDVAFALVVAVITYGSLVIGELVPKRLAIAHAERMAAVVAYPMHYFSKIGAPFVWLLEKSSDILLHIIPGGEADISVVTEEEVKSMIAEGADAGVIEPAEAQMLEGVLRMADRTVRAIMTPRPQVLWLDITHPIAAQVQNLSGVEYSRLPAGRGSLDNLAGVIYAKDLLNAYLRGITPDIAGMLREPLTVHDAMPVLKLVDLFRSTRQHMAVVVDEHGSVEGIVTATDVLEAVTGTVPEAMMGDETMVIRRSDGSLLVDAMIPIDELASHLGVRDMQEPNDDFNTLAGFALRELGHLPKTGEHFNWRGFTFEIIDMDARRIDKILIRLPSKPTEEE